MELILVPAFAILVAMVALVFWLGRQLVLNKRSRDPLASTPKDPTEEEDVDRHIG